jgi:hypothetical protein
VMSVTKVRKPSWRISMLWTPDPSCTTRRSESLSHFSPSIVTCAPRAGHAARANRTEQTTPRFDLVHPVGRVRRFAGRRRRRDRADGSASPAQAAPLRADAERVARLQKDLPLEDTMPRQVELHGVIAGPTRSRSNVPSKSSTVPADTHRCTPRSPSVSPGAEATNSGHRDRNSGSRRRSHTDSRTHTHTGIQPDADAESITGSVVRISARVGVAVVEAAVIARRVYRDP